MGRFGRMLGKLSLKVAGEEIELTPKLGDNEKLMKIQSVKDDDTKMVKIKEFIQELILREYPEEPAEEVKLFVELNINELVREILIAFRWTTREKLEKVEVQQEKNLM